MGVSGCSGWWHLLRSLRSASLVGLGFAKGTGCWLRRAPFVRWTFPRNERG